MKSSGKLFVRILSGAMATFASLLAIVPCAGAQPSAIAPYELKTFPGTPTEGATAPDDLAISADGTRLWVGYGNGNAPDGSDGKSSNVIEYDIASGAVLKISR
jgi:hypothetical protein